MLNIIDRRIWAAIGGAAILAASALPALAATEQGVTATVTVENIAISVSDGSIAYGTLAANTSQDTVTLTDPQTVTNDGNIAENFLIRGQNSASWTLAAAAASEAYKHEFSITATFPGTALTTTNQSLATNIATLGTTTLDLQITTPTVTAATNVQSVNVTVVATAN